MCTDDDWRCGQCPARRIIAGSRAVAEALPVLGTVVSVTANDAALISHTGEYLPVALPGEALVCGEDQIGLRMHPDRVEEASLTPRAVTLADRAGYHRAHLTPFSDRLAFDVLELAPSEEAEAFEPLDWSRLSWREADQLVHLDSLTLDRYTVLPFTGSRRVDPAVIPCLLQHLDEAGLPFTTAVPGGGCVQLHRGPCTAVGEEGDHVAVMFASARYVMAPYFVAACWVTQASGAMGPTSAIELYDHNHQCVTVLTQTGPVSTHLHEAWEGVVASLPDDER